MFLKRKSLIALCICLAVAQACKHESDSLSEFRLKHEVSPQPPHVGQVTITLSVTDASGGPVTDARIKLEGNMSHPGMVPVFSDARETGPGRYLSAMELSMAGDWYVIAHVTLPDGRKLDRQFEIKVVGQPNRLLKKQFWSLEVRFSLRASAFSASRR